MISRRQFLKMSMAVGAALAFPTAFSLDVPTALAFYQSGKLKKFAQPFRGVGPGGIPVAAPDSFTAPVTRVKHYSLTIGEFKDTLHPALDATTLWGYNPSVPLGGGMQPQKHLGGIIVAQRNEPIQLTFTNKLPPTHILPVDTTSIFPDAAGKFGGKGFNAATVHLHGGFVPWISDGGPMTWFNPYGDYGSSTQSSAGNIYKLLNPGLKPGQAEYYYPNQQSARMMWHHDHAHDITRLNAYAGIASAYIIRDAFEGGLRNQGLPEFVENGGRELPIVIQDKIFVNAATIGTLDPSWTGLKTTGSLWYPHTYETDRWDAAEGTVLDANGNVPIEPSCIPEMFGDTMLANGTVFPEAGVEARRYRLRVLNVCQARFLNLQLYVDDGSPDGITLDANFNPTNRPGPNFLVIGTEGGFLSTPAAVSSHTPFSVQNDPVSGDPIPSTIRGSLITAPAVRWDILVDFSGFAGQKIILYNDAPAPFPMGEAANDYFPGAPDNPTQPQPGFGPNTRQIMRFKVHPAKGIDPRLNILPGTNLKAGIDPSLVGLWTTAPLPPPPGVPVRQLTLNEDFDSFGRLIQREGTDVRRVSDQTGTLTNGMGYMDMPTEMPRAGATQVWQIANLTGDTHPIHFHLVNVQVLSRQPFTTYNYGKKVGKSGQPKGLGALRGPDPVELGWKETVLMHPGEITTVIMKFDLPANPPHVTVPFSPMGGNMGYEYVWHCHILDHEEHDMMRPLIVMP